MRLRDEFLGPGLCLSGALTHLLKDYKVLPFVISRSFANRLFKATSVLASQS